MESVIGKVVSPSQNAFVNGRQILNSSLIANEAVYFLLRRKESGLLCKSDIVKVYDHIGWDFVLQVMKNMGFGNKWLNWIKWCILCISMTTF